MSYNPKRMYAFKKEHHGICYSKKLGSVRGANSSSINDLNKRTSINLTTINCRSLCNKTVGILTHIEELNTDIALLQETWLSSTDKAKFSEIKELGFNMYSQPRKGRGGGLAFLYKKDIDLKQNINIGKYRTFEVQECTLKGDLGLIRLVNIYRPPYSKKNKATPTMFLEDFSEYLETLVNKPGKVIIAGDFNLHIEKIGLPGEDIYIPCNS